jgi:hypothetical protein
MAPSRILDGHKKKNQTSSTKDVHLPFAYLPTKFHKGHFTELLGKFGVTGF